MEGVRRSSESVFVQVSNLNHPWHNVRLFPLIISLVTREGGPHLPTTSSQGVVESNEASSEPSLLRTNKTIESGIAHTHSLKKELCLLQVPYHCARSHKKETSNHFLATSSGLEA